MAAAGQQSFLLDALEPLEEVRYLTIRAFGKDAAGITHLVAMTDNHNRKQWVLPFTHMPLFNIATYNDETRIAGKDGPPILICKGSLNNFADNMAIFWGTGEKAAEIKDNIVLNLFDGQCKKLMACSIVDFVGNNEMIDIRLHVSGTINHIKTCTMKLRGGKENLYIENLHDGLSRFEKALTIIIAFKAFYSLYKLHTSIMPIALPGSMSCVMAAPPSLNVLEGIQHIRLRAASTIAYKPIKYAEVLDETNGFPLMILENRGSPPTNLMEITLKDICGTTLLVFNSSPTPARSLSVRKYDNTLIGNIVEDDIFNSTGTIVLKVQLMYDSRSKLDNTFEYYDSRDQGKRTLAVSYTPDCGSTVSLRFLKEMSIEHKALVIAMFADTAIRFYELYNQCVPTLKCYRFRPHQHNL